MKNSLFLVESPLQLLCAYEAINYFEVKNYSILIRLSGSEYNDNQINRLIKTLEIEPDKIETILIQTTKRRFRDFCNFLFYMFRYLLVRTSFDFIYIGSYRSRFFRNILYQFSPQVKLILIDDGNQTIDVQKQFSDINFLNLFTMFDLVPFEKQLIYKNSFTALSNIILNSKPISENLLFIGCGISAAGIISQDEYVELIEKVSLFYKKKNKVLTYLPHRNEKEQLISSITSLENVSVKRIDYPIEFLGLYNEVLYKKASSFYSTALITMRDIYGMDIECFYFDYTDSEYKTEIDAVYDYYEKEMNVINLINYTDS